MATTNYPTNHPLAVKLWAKTTFVQALRETYFYKFMSKGKNGLITFQDETKKSAGDRVTVGLRMQLDGDGIQGDNTLEGNEEAIVKYTDNLLIDQLRHATRSGGEMSQQRTLDDMRMDNKDSLKDWWADRIDTCMFNQLAGNTAVSDTRRTGNNATLAPSANNHLWIDSDIATGDESIGTTDTFNTAMIDRMKTRAETMEDQTTSQPNIRPFTIMGQKKYVLFLHPYQAHSLRREATANTVTWWEVNRSGLSGGIPEAAKALYEGSMGEYNNVIIHVSQRVPQGVNSSTGVAISTVRRAIFCGAQAAMFGLGRKTDLPSPEKMTWREEEFDYGNQLGVAAGCIFGIKKARFNSADFGVIVGSSYATNPTA